MMKSTHITAESSRESSAPATKAFVSRGSSPGGAPEGRVYGPGDVLAGKYRIVDLLGEGGMGCVWRAHSLLLDTDVAIKVLHRQQGDARAADRLLREARTLARLGHPAIVRGYDFGETETGEPFLVMELLEGVSLAHWIDGQGRMSATQAVQMLLPIAGALVAAHAHGIVHRDIKPENIIAVPDGSGAYQPKIVDFGIAKLLAGPTGQVLTQAGMVLGSLEYMSPEQADGTSEVGEQTDVWALSVVLYELVTGRRPFEAPTITAMVYALYTCAPIPTTQLAAGDDELWAIIERGLRRSLDERWPTMRAFGHALASWAILRGITADAAGASLSHHWLARTSEPPVLAPTSGPISTVSTSIAPSSPRPPRSLEPWPPRGSAPPSAPPTSLVETTSASSVAPLRATPPPQTPALFLRAAVGLALVPLLVVAGLLLQHGDGSASAGERPAPSAEERLAPSASGPAPEVVPTALASSLAVVAEPAGAASAVPTAGVAPGAGAASKLRRRAAPPSPSRPATTSMPLPSAPSY
jgi:serine/threonine-protein kinase